MNNHTTTRKRHPRTLLALAVLFVLAVYVGAYFVNLDSSFIIYMSPGVPRGNGPGYDFDRETNEVPRYVAFQEVSEVVFWPVHRVHRMIYPQRFEYDADKHDPNDESTYPDFRDKWW